MQLFLRYCYQSETNNANGISYWEVKSTGRINIVYQGEKAYLNFALTMLIYGFLSRFLQFIVLQGAFFRVRGRGKRCRCSFCSTLYRSKVETIFDH